MTSDLDPPSNVQWNGGPRPRRPSSSREAASDPSSESMSIVVSLAELVAELDLVSRRRRMALDVTTGAFVELAGDRGDAAQAARVDVGELVLLPRVEDLAETELARRFAQLRDDPEQRETLLWALRGSGSLVCFRDAARRLAVLDEWTFERNRHIAEWAVRWLDRNALDYHRDLPRWGRLRRV